MLYKLYYIIYIYTYYFWGICTDISHPRRYAPYGKAVTSEPKYSKTA